jgi:protease-4
MSYKTASAILRGQWLIEPGYAKAQLPLILEMVKGQVSAHATINEVSHLQSSRPTFSLPERKQLSSVQQSNLYGVTPYTSVDSLPKDSIAMINIIGPVLKYGDYCTYGSVEYNDLLIRLSNSDKVKGVILNIDSPGGQVDGTATFAGTIREVNLLKPVFGIVQNGMAASAAMWIGSACQELYVTQVTDTVGSIGAYCTIYDFAEYLKANGVQIHDIYAPQSVDKNKNYKEAIKGDYSMIEADLKFIVDHFVKAVKSNRGPRLNTTNENPFTGKMYKAADALKVGLIDGIKSLGAVVARMEESIKIKAAGASASTQTISQKKSSITIPKETKKENVPGANELEFQQRLYALLN